MGFPQPKTKLTPDREESRSRPSGNRTVPMGSICAKGLSVRRPAARGVGSPRRSAARACAYSWIPIEIMRKPMYSKRTIIWLIIRAFVSNGMGGGMSLFMVKFGHGKRKIWLCNLR